VLDAHLLASVRLKARRRTISSNDTLSIWLYQAFNCKLVRRSWVRFSNRHWLQWREGYLGLWKRPHSEVLCCKAIAVISSGNRTAEGKKRCGGKFMANHVPA
jgi:hypothetical protein